MRVPVAVLSALALAAAPAAAQGTPELTITSPLPGAQVVPRDTIAGTLTPAGAVVWVVIHPTATSDFWVQPPVTVRNDGTWRVLGYFGRPGSLDRGAHFQIRAFSGPGLALSEGRINNWPEAAGRSDVVEVTRR